MVPSFSFCNSVFKAFIIVGQAFISFTRYLSQEAIGFESRSWNVVSGREVLRVDGCFCWVWGVRLNLSAGLIVH